MADYEVLEDNWNINEHFNYMGCCEGDGREKYYVLMDKNGMPLFTSRDKDEVIRDASRRDVRNHHWVTVLPIGGVMLPLPPEVPKQVDVKQ